jgi:hypothetical protein
MLRVSLAAIGLLAASPFLASAAEISGDYLETRTCDIYTGPCFANSEVGLTGNQAIMAWNVEEGSHKGIDLSGLKVVLAVQASDTLGFGGGLVVNPDPIRSVVLVDERATPEQRAALIDFACERAGRVAGEVVRVDTVPIDMSLNHVRMVGRLTAGKAVAIETRALEARDQCCTNEIVFYPPLTDVENAAPAFTLQGKFSGRGLGARWSHPDSRSAFLATFAY